MQLRRCNLYLLASMLAIAAVQPGCGPDLASQPAAVLLASGGGTFRSASALLSKSVGAAAPAVRQTDPPDLLLATLVALAPTCTPPTGPLGTEPTAVHLEASTATPVFGQRIRYTATVKTMAGSPTGSVQFTDNGSVICCSNFDGSTSTVTCDLADPCAPAGPHKIVATYLGDGILSKSSAQVDLTIAGAETKTALSLPPSPAVVGALVTYAAAVSGKDPTSCPLEGTLSFSNDSLELPGCTDVPLAVGSCATTYIREERALVEVSYKGNANFLPSKATATQDVTLAATVTSLASFPAAAVVGQAIKVTATVTRQGPGSCVPSGLVDFTDNGISVPGCSAVSLAGSQASCPLTYHQVGSHIIQATYNGSSTCNPSSGSYAVSVAKASTQTTVTSSGGVSEIGQPVTYFATVHVSSPGSGSVGGSITIKDNGAAIAGCSALAVPAADPQTVSCKTTYSSSMLGSHTILAAYSGDTNYFKSSGDLTETINKDSTQTTELRCGNLGFVGQQVGFSAQVKPLRGGGVPTGTVTFSVDGGSLFASLGGGIASLDSFFSHAGDHAVTATYAGDSTFAGSSGSCTVTIGRANTQVTMTSRRTSVGAFLNYTYTATISAVAPGHGRPTGRVDFAVSGGYPGSCLAAPLDYANTASCDVGFMYTAGTHTVVVTYYGDGDFNGSSGSTSTTL